MRRQAFSHPVADSESEERTAAADFHFRKSLSLSLSGFAWGLDPGGGQWSRMLPSINLVLSGADV